MVWITDNLQVASSAELGENVEGVKALSKKFNQFMVSVRAVEQKVLDDQSLRAANLIAVAHPQLTEIVKLQAVSARQAFAVCTWGRITYSVHSTPGRGGEGKGCVLCLGRCKHVSAESVGR